MKAKSIWSPAAVLAVALAIPVVQAQDPAEVAPEIYKCTFENDHARLCEVTFAPGQKIAPHSHPQHMVYVLQPGKLRITQVGGEAADVDFSAGQVAWIGAETHHAKNIGDTTLKGLIIEFRDLKENDKPAMAKDKPAKEDKGKDDRQDKE